MGSEAREKYVFLASIPSLAFGFSLVPDLLFDCLHLLEYAKIRTVLQSRKQTTITLESEGENNGKVIRGQINSQEFSGEKDTSTYSQIVKVIAKKTFRVIIFLGTLARPRLHYNYHLRWQMTFVKSSNKSFSSV